MKKYHFLIAVLIIVLASCSTPKTYFTPQIRGRVEQGKVPLAKLQYYVDRDVELRRELVTGETKVSSGKVKFIDGKYVNVIVLKKNTRGVCTMSQPDKIMISFEVGEGKFITFGKTKAGSNTDPYRILANVWVKDCGEIEYEGKKYFIQPAGTEASIMIKKSVFRKSEFKTRTMKGVKVS